MATKIVCLVLWARLPATFSKRGLSNLEEHGGQRKKVALRNTEIRDKNSAWSMDPFTSVTLEGNCGFDAITIK